jgi:hypothetical protein
MTDDRIAQLEAALALERAKVHELSAALAVAVQRSAEADASRARRDEAEAHSKALRRERNRRHRDARKTDLSVSEDVSETSHPPSPSPPLPSSFPPSPAPSSPYPLSFPPSSPPPVPPATAGAAQGLLGIILEPKAAKRSRPRKDGTPPDPRHAPLVKALTEAGFPFLGGRDAKNVTALLAIADQQPATRGELAHAEILRRARLGWAQRPGFHSAGSLSALLAKWGDLERPADGGTGPDPNGGAGRAESAECAGCGEVGAGGAVGEPMVWLCYGCGCLSAFSDALEHHEVLHYREAASWAKERRHAR